MLRRLDYRSFVAVNVTASDIVNAGAPFTELTRRLGVDVDLVTRDSLKPRIETRVADDIVYV